MAKPDIDTDGDQSFTMRTDAALREDLDKVKTMIHARTRAETIRRVVHLARRLLEADPTQNDKVTVLTDEGEKRDVFV